MPGACHERWPSSERAGPDLRDWRGRGLAFLIGVLAVSPEAAATLLDLHRDGVDMKDALALAWLFGHAAILIHHVLPGIARV